MTAFDGPTELSVRARNIICRLAKDCTEGRQKSSMTSSIYNTAWISMISKHIDGECRWLFPECFRYILDSQLSNGGWQNYKPDEAGIAAEGDGIINTMAALLALQTHQTSPQVFGASMPHDLDERISNATSALQSMLHVWDVGSCDNIAFEITVPAHLEMLEEHGFDFSFAGRELLMAKRQRKMSRFKPAYLYGETVTSLLYSLEALIGKVDFDRVAHHRTHGGMMSSPASTAAYLMNTSVWDEESEQYLRSTLSAGAASYVWPTIIFEISWVVKTFLTGGLTPDCLGLSQLKVVADFVENTLRKQDGIVGWAPGVICEADDTSCAVYILNMLGRPTHPDRLLASFESKDFFRCFTLESSPSLSVNSHVLTALLHTPSPTLYQSQILKAASFICDCWWDGNMEDKWSMTEMYPTMLISQALISLLASWDNGQLSNISEGFLKNRVLIALFGIFVATLKAQNSDGSWGIRPSRETTAYALIVLASTASLPLASRLDSKLHVATNAGRDFLLRHREFWSEPDYVWRGKATYGSGLLAETYVITALGIATPSHKLGPSIDRLCELEDQHRDLIFPRLMHLPIFSDTPAWLVEAAIIEGYLYKPMMRQADLDAFPRRDIIATKHIDITTFFWTGPNHVKGAGISPSMMFQMMVASLLIYEIDHYMEKYIARLGPTETNSLRALIDSFFDEHDSDTETSRNEMSEAPQTLNCFTKWYLQNPSVLRTSTFDRNLLKKELRLFLHANVASVEESSRLASPDSRSTPAQPFGARETFYDWVHGTSARHVGIPLLFTFFVCLLGAQQYGSRECLPSMQTKYLAQDLCGHLATLGRIENDYGSLARDLEELNLNCVNFPEFFTKSDDGNSTLDVSAAKERLKWLAAFERECYETTMRRLETLVDFTTSKSMRTFCKAIDLGGQIYDANDPAPKIEK